MTALNTPHKNDKTKYSINLLINECTTLFLRKNSIEEELKELNDAKNKAATENGIRSLLANYGEDKEIKHEFFLYPLLRWRLYSHFENGIEQSGMSDYVQLFTLENGK